ncbi:MAG: hypothetical protein ACE5E8_06865, partial [Acidimicrobiia bacterium]
SSNMWRLSSAASTCPTHWNVSPLEAMEFVKDAVIDKYPLGVFVDRRRGNEGSPSGGEREMRDRLGLQG